MSHYMICGCPLVFIEGWVILRLPTIKNYLRNVFFAFFSDKRLALIRFSRSQFLPYPQDYKTKGKNPILICLLDQMKHDQELSIKYPSQTALIDDIISALETGRIRWPSAFNLISSEQWIQKMRANPDFYFYHARNSSEMQKYENLIGQRVALVNQKAYVISII